VLSFLINNLINNRRRDAKGRSPFSTVLSVTFFGTTTMKDFLNDLFKILIIFFLAAQTYILLSLRMDNGWLKTTWFPF